MNKLMFCANCQKETQHAVRLSPSGESIFICGCGRFLKFPVGFTEKQLEDYSKKHAKGNKGQVSLVKVIEQLGLKKVKKS
jgi:hypothetical protein